MLRTQLGVAHECYASPLNRTLDSFNSAFADTDHFFGSQGSYDPEFNPQTGIYEVNPPFDGGSVRACFSRIAQLLQKNRYGLAFVVTVPSMDGVRMLEHYDQTVKDFFLECLVLPKGTHAYKMGLQHKPTGDSCPFWVPEKDTLLLFFANELGKEYYSKLVGVGLKNKLTAAFNPPTLSKN